MRCVCRWGAGMPASWVAAAFLETEKHFRRIMAYTICGSESKLRSEQLKAKQAVA